MRVTISTENSTNPRHAAQKHNRRDPQVVSKEDHIRPDGVCEIWLDEDIHDAYHRLFEDARVAYNEKQSRQERRIPDYLQHVRMDKQRSEVCEMIIGVYPYDREGPAEELDNHLARSILLDFCDSWSDRNPNMFPIGMYYHDDEQGRAPHVHIDYVPMSFENKIGMETQVSLRGAFNQMGFGTHWNAIALWTKSQNQELERICREQGLTVEHPDRGKGIKHLEKELYKMTKAFEKTRSQYLEVTVENERIKEGFQVEKERLLEEIRTLKEENRTERERSVRLKGIMPRTLSAGDIDAMTREISSLQTACAEKDLMLDEYHRIIDLLKQELAEEKKLHEKSFDQLVQEVHDRSQLQRFQDLLERFPDQINQLELDMNKGKERESGRDWLEH